MPSDITSIVPAMVDSVATDASGNMEVAPHSPLSTAAGKRTSSASVVTPIKVEPPTTKKAKQSLPPIKSIVFHDRDQATKSLQAIRGPKCTVPEKLTDIIAAILSLYPVADLKLYWEDQFHGGEQWKNKSTAVRVLTLKVATNDKNSPVVVTTSSTKPATPVTQNSTIDDADINKK